MSDDGRLQVLLREQGEEDEAIAALTPVLARLGEWSAPTPTANDHRRLLAALTPLLRAPSPVRQAIRERRRSPAADLGLFLTVARQQVRVLRPGFGPAAPSSRCWGCWSR